MAFAKSTNVCIIAIAKVFNEPEFHALILQYKIFKLAKISLEFSIMTMIIFFGIFLVAKMQIEAKKTY